MGRSGIGALRRKRKRCLRTPEKRKRRVLDVFSEEPGVPLHCGNFLDGRLTGKAGKPCIDRATFILETQHFPKSPNLPDFPDTILRPGETDTSNPLLRFSVRED